MSKICPNCQEMFDDNHAFCSSCGSRLVEMEKPAPTLNLGDANAISGGVNINQSKNITTHDTHYHSTTVQERSKSESELKLDANNQLRAKAEEIMAERGRIDSIAMGQLRPLALQLGIDEETFKIIIKEVRSNRNGGASGLSAANARYLQQAQQAVQTNDMDALSNLTPRLEAMAAISQDDNVQYLYYLTLCLLYPLKSMEVYERQTDENYWRTFWAIISYIRTGKYAEATSLLALFDPLRYEKSEDDQNLLEAYFNIMKEDKDGAQEFLDEILGEPSAQVKPLHRAVESTLYEENAESLEVRFYTERVLTKSDVVVKTQKNVEPSTPIEEPTKQTPKPESINKGSKEADELYAKASAASGAKRVMLLQKAADVGSLEAMYDLGDCYYDGEGVDKNMPLAIKWLTKSADAGYILAQAALGGTYFTGAEGLEQNYALSEKYLLMAAEKGNTDAQAGLAVLYVNMEEYDKALKWARKGAQASNPIAYYMLGRAYSEGLGVEVNELEGLKWYEEAAKYGDADAQNICGNIYHDADFIEHDPQKAFKYYQMAAAQGHGYGMLNLGLCYVNGDGTAKNLTLAEEWLRKAADAGVEEAIGFLKDVFDKPNYEDLTINDLKEISQNGDPDAMAELGRRYYIGKNVKKNIKEAIKWYRKAAEFGHTKAIKEVGMLLYFNHEYAESITWLQKGAEMGSAECMGFLGNCYYYGSGVKSNLKEALMWYKKSKEHETDDDSHPLVDDCIELIERQISNGDDTLTSDFDDLMEQAKNGDPDAMADLGRMYEEGDNVELNIKEAIKWYKKAGELGNVGALMSLASLSESPVKAVKWWRKAAELGDAEACRNLGVVNQTKNVAEAIKWYQKALNYGYEDDDGEIKSILENLKSQKPDVEITKVWADNCMGSKQVVIHFNLKFNKKVYQACVIPISDDGFNLEWNWAFYENPSFMKELYDQCYVFSAKELGLTDGIYSIKFSFFAFCSSDNGEDLSDGEFTRRLEMAQDAPPISQLEIKFKVTSHLFSANDIEIIPKMRL